MNETTRGSARFVELTARPALGRIQEVDAIKATETENMEPTKELIDDIYRERVLRAWRTPPEEKLFDGARLLDYACGITLAGIRYQHPDADEQQVREILAQRLALRQRLEERSG